MFPLELQIQVADALMVASEAASEAAAVGVGHQRSRTTKASWLQLRSKVTEVSHCWGWCWRDVEPMRWNLSLKKKRKTVHKCNKSKSKKSCECWQFNNLLYDIIVCTEKMRRMTLRIEHRFRCSIMNTNTWKSNHWLVMLDLTVGAILRPSRCWTILESYAESYLARRLRLSALSAESVAI